MQYIVTVQLAGRLVCSDCFYASRGVVDGPVSVLTINTHGEITGAYEGRMEGGKIVRTF
jgi:hypothetical protein